MLSASICTMHIWILNKRERCVYSTVDSVPSAHTLVYFILIACMHDVCFTSKYLWFSIFTVQLKISSATWAFAIAIEICIYLQRNDHFSCVILIHSFFFLRSACAKRTWNDSPPMNRVFYEKKIRENKQKTDWDLFATENIWHDIARVNTLTLCLHTVQFSSVQMEFVEIKSAMSHHWNRVYDNTVFAIAWKFNIGHRKE